MVRDLELTARISVGELQADRSPSPAQDVHDERQVDSDLRARRDRRHRRHHPAHSRRLRGLRQEVAIQKAKAAELL